MKSYKYNGSSLILSLPSIGYSDAIKVSCTTEQPADKGDLELFEIGKKRKSWVRGSWNNELNLSTYQQWQSTDCRVCIIRFWKDVLCKTGKCCISFHKTKLHYNMQTLTLLRLIPNDLHPKFWWQTSVCTMEGFPLWATGEGPTHPTKSWCLTPWSRKGNRSGAYDGKGQFAIHPFPVHEQKCLYLDRGLVSSQSWLIEINPEFLSCLSIRTLPTYD